MNKINKMEYFHYIIFPLKHLILWNYNPYIQFQQINNSVPKICLFYYFNDILFFDKKMSLIIPPLIPIIVIIIEIQCNNEYLYFKIIIDLS